jgi:hypothetical protein
VYNPIQLLIDKDIVMQLPTMFLLLCVFSSTAHAEVMGQMMARSANPTYEPSSSIEIGASHFTRQLQWQALRFNLKTSHDVVLYADYANIQASDLPLSNTVTAAFGGHGFGAGIIFPIDQRYIPGIEFALNLSAHYALLPQTNTTSPVESGNDRKLLQRQSVIKLLLSPLDPILENGLSWFVTLAYLRGEARVKLATDSIAYRPTAELAVGAGLLLPIKYGKVYAGIESHAQNQLLNVGVRYHF